MTTFCHRHREKKARRKCYVCREIICVDCYYRRDRHIFCGPGCYLRWKRGDVAGRIRDVFTRPIPIHAAVLVLVAAMIPVAWVLTEASAELEGGLLHRGEVRASSAAVAARIVSIVENDDVMTIVGEATPRSVIFLLRDGVAVRNSSAGQEGRFRFELPLESSSATFSVAAVAAREFSSASFVPAQPSRRKEIETLIAREAVHSNRARFVESFTRGRSDTPHVVLTLDAGSSDSGAREILATLRSRGLRTTLFLTGEFITRYPDIVKEAVADGHEIGNHTWSHPRLTSFAKNSRHDTLPSMTRERLHDELQRTAAAFHRLTGEEMAPYWRAPFGEENSEIRGWAAELGYLHVGWTRGRRYNLDTLDWVVDRSSRLYFTPPQLIDRMLAFGEANGSTLNGGIILMHLGTDRDGDERLGSALPEMIERFEASGYRFVKVSELRRGVGNAG
jgi:peptidoglycan/xylan/chitin deacetylase (PgdA/CDA1 family)